MAAKMSGTNVRLYFRDDENTSCSKRDWKYLSDYGFYYLRMED